MFSGKDARLIKMSQERRMKEVNEKNIDIKKYLKNVDFELKYFENYIDDHVKMLNENNLKTCAWIECKNLVELENPHNTEKYYQCEFSDITLSKV